MSCTNPECAEKLAELMEQIGYLRAQRDDALKDAISSRLDANTLRARVSELEQHHVVR